MDQKISIIIPVYNEEKTIEKLLSHLQECISGYESEIVVVDGKSLDKTAEVVQSCGVRLLISKKRAEQLR